MRSDEAIKGSGAAKLHRAGEDYLKTILALQMAYGGVRSADVAKELNCWRNADGSMCIFASRN